MLPVTLPAVNVAAPDMYSDNEEQGRLCTHARLHGDLLPEPYMEI